ncbi:MAG: hypothetical protein ACMUIE_09915 [Thermoplasmatota archaeon]
MAPPGGSELIHKRPLVVGIGGVGTGYASHLAGRRMIDALCLDTDRRPISGLPPPFSLLIGEKLLKGEGSGGNLNAAKAAFKLGMEALAPRLLGRPLVITVASGNGATGISGSVEISQLLSRVGLPCFSLLISGGLTDGSGPVPMAAMLLEGPIAPGALVRVLPGKEQELGMNISTILEASYPGGPFPIPSTAWNLLRDRKGRYDFLELDFQGARSYLDIQRPSIIAMSVDHRLSVEEMRSMIIRRFGDPEGLAIGMALKEGTEGAAGCAVVPASGPLPEVQGDRMIGLDQLRGLVENGMEDQLEPGRSI